MHQSEVFAAILYQSGAFCRPQAPARSFENPRPSPQRSQGGARGCGGSAKRTQVTSGAETVEAAQRRAQGA